MFTVAIVEDDVYISNMLSELLCRHGYKTLRAYSGSEALLLFERSVPDLAILDLMLPGVCGEEVLIGGRFPVIVLSAKTEVGGKVKALESGACDYVTKPFDNDELLARIAVHLRGAEQKYARSEKGVFPFGFGRSHRGFFVGRRRVVRQRAYQQSAEKVGVRNG